MLHTFPLASPDPTSPMDPSTCIWRPTHTLPTPHSMGVPMLPLTERMYTEAMGSSTSKYAALFLSRSHSLGRAHSLSLSLFLGGGVLAAAAGPTAAKSQSAHRFSVPPSPIPPYLPACESQTHDSLSQMRRAVARASMLTLWLSGGPRHCGDISTASLG